MTVKEDCFQDTLSMIRSMKENRKLLKLHAIKKFVTSAEYMIDHRTIFSYDLIDAQTQKLIVLLSGPLLTAA